jgi:hypothetical protein
MPTMRRHGVKAASPAASPAAQPRRVGVPPRIIATYRTSGGG